MISLIAFVFSAKFILGLVIGAAGMYIFKPIVEKLIEKLNTKV